MKLKVFFLFIISLFFVDVFTQDYAIIHEKLTVLKQKDSLAQWINLYLEIESIHYSKKNAALGEAVCDNILKELWREAESKQEFDELFKVYWYKALYIKDRGEVVFAKNNYEKALSIYEKSSKNIPENLLYIYPVLGNIYTILGDNDKAVVVHKKMIELLYSDIVFEGKNDFLKIAYTNLAITYETQSKIELAISTIEKIFKLNGLTQNQLGNVYNNYGKFLYQNNELLNAEKHLLIAKEILLKKQEKDYYGLGSLFKTLAFVSIEKELYDLANKQYDLAITNYKKSSTNKNREIAKTYLEKSKISNNKLELLDKALQYLIPHEITEDFNFFPSKEQLFAENTLADIFYEKTKLVGVLSDKLHYYDLVFEVQKKIRNEYLYKKSKQKSFEEDRMKIEEAIFLCSYMYSISKEDKYAEKALGYVENAKSILLFESLVNNNNFEGSEIVSENLKKKRELIDNLINSRLENDLIQIKIDVESLKKFTFDVDINSDKKFLQKNNFDGFNIDDFKNNYLSSKGCLLELYDGKALYVVTITKDKSTIERIEKSNLFSSKLFEFKNLFVFKNRYVFNRDLALYFGEIFSKNIPENINKIFLSTDGVFNNIPFESFILDKKYFLEKYEIQYIFSANILQNIKYNKSNNGQVLAVAPVFENDMSKHLKKSEKEIENILNKIKGTCLVHKNAIAPNFLREAKMYTILHISSHAQIDGKLNTASIDFYDKSLYFSQIQEQKFETDLMVLSACETGVGNTEIGEGSMSLTRAFAYSNIPSIISSLWKVNEESSLQIFDFFYEGVAKDESISIALRNAKIRYLNNTEIAEEKKQPYFWASFVFVGEDQVLDLQKVDAFNWFFYLFVGVFISFLILFLIKKLKQQ